MSTLTTCNDTASRPTTAQVGEILFQKDLNEMIVCNGAGPPPTWASYNVEGAFPWPERSRGLWSVGSGNDGALGNGLDMNSVPPYGLTSPYNVAASGVYTEIAAGWNCNLLLKSNGSLWCFGKGSAGQFGDGANGNRLTPYASLVTSGVSKIAVGWTHTMIIKSDTSGMDGNPNSLWVTGDNGAAQLGIGNQTYQNTFVEATHYNASSHAVLEIAAGVDHSMFIKSDGSVWGMGANSEGQQGVGNTQGGGTWGKWPRAATGAGTSNVVKISAGDEHTHFVKSDGSLWGMGSNFNGCLGDGSGSGQVNPVQILASGVAQVSAGHTHTVIIKTDGSLWAMGKNLYGQLGDGTTTDRTTPVQIDTSVAQVSAGDSHTLYIKTDGSLWGMGGNWNGQLGLGDLDKRISPTELIGAGSLSNVTRIAAGRNHSILLEV
jgi:alpha-tubulin suppressor-like RCC1 family protein